MANSNHIALESLRQSRKQKLEIIMLAYADDSSDEKGERIFAIASIMGTQEE